MSLQERMDSGADGMMLSQCMTCERLQKHARCDAYPDGVPEAILKNQVDHREPFSGDGDLTYVPCLDRYGKTMTHIFDTPTVKARYKSTGRRDIG